MPIDTETENFLSQAVDRLQLSGRAYFRVLKLARTIADLEEAKTVTLAHVSEALGYRKR